MMAFKIKVLLLSSKELLPYRRALVIRKSFLSKIFLLMFLLVFRKIDLSLAVFMLRRNLRLDVFYDNLKSARRRKRSHY